MNPITRGVPFGRRSPLQRGPFSTPKHIKTWLELSEITVGPLFRKVNRGGVVERARLTTDAVRQILLKRAAKAGLKGTLAEPFSPHGLRAGFVTTAYRNGVPDEEIMGHTRHRSLTTMRSYVRRAKLMRSARATIAGFELMRMFRKGQFRFWIEAIGGGTEVRFINRLFGLYA